MDVIIRADMGSDDAMQLFENHFLDDSAKRVNDDVWLELSLDLFKLKIASKNEKVNHKKVLNKIRRQISELANIRTGSEHSSNVMAKTIAAVSDVGAFKFLYRNPPRQLQALISK